MRVSIKRTEAFTGLRRLYNATRPYIIRINGDVVGEVRFEGQKSGWVFWVQSEKYRLAHYCHDFPCSGELARKQAREYTQRMMKPPLAQAPPRIISSAYTQHLLELERLVRERCADAVPEWFASARRVLAEIDILTFAEEKQKKHGS